MMERTKFALEEITAHLSTCGRNPLIESYFVQCLLVMFYSEAEETIKRIISRRLSAVQDVKVAHFIFKTNEAMIKRVKKAEINDVLQMFDCGDGDVIGRAVEDINLQPYFDAITNRHMVSHQDGTSMTLDEFSKAIPCAERIFAAVEGIIRPSEAA